MSALSANLLINHLYGGLYELYPVPAQVPADKLERDIYGTDENMCQSGVDFVYPGADNGGAFECRTFLQSQVNLLDEIVGEVINEIVQHDLWEDTLIVFASDNVCPYMT